MKITTNQHLEAGLQRLAGVLGMDYCMTRYKPNSLTIGNQNNRYRLEYVKDGNGTVTRLTDYMTKGGIYHFMSNYVEMTLTLRGYKDASND